MEIQQLEAFAAAMSSGSISAAAQLLARSQSAVTRLVQELEAEIGYALFSRNGPRVTPTAQGFLLYEDVERATEIARGDVQPPLLAHSGLYALVDSPAALRGRAGAGCPPGRSQHRVHPVPQMGGAVHGNDRETILLAQSLWILLTNIARKALTNVYQLKHGMLSEYLRHELRSPSVWMVLA